MHTFGNAAELIIAVIAALERHERRGQASIAGSIIGNILLVLGTVDLVRRDKVLASNG